MNRKLRIVFITTGLHNGGAETMLYHMMRFIDRERFDPVVISLLDRGKFGDPIAQLGVPVQTVDMQPGRPTPAAFWRLLRLVRAARPDVLQGWMYHANIAAQLVSLSVRVPVCWCVHSSFQSFAVEKPLTRVMIWLAAQVSRRAARVVYVSAISRPQHEKLGFAADRGQVIANGIDLDLFQPSAAARESVRAELGLPGTAPLIGLMARYHPLKDHPNFFRAAALLARQRPEVHFVLAGTGVEAANPALAELRQTLGLAGRVHLLGERHDMPRLNAALDIATLSSSAEAHSLAITEAMACAIPCVVTDVGDSGRVVGKAGVVVPPGDAPALAAGWERLLAAGAEARRALGAAARQRTEDDFSIVAAVRSYEELYYSLI